MNASHGITAEYHRRTKRWYLADADGHKTGIGTYPTKDAAEAEIPTWVAIQAKKAAKKAQAATETPAPIAPAPQRRYRTVRSGFYGVGRIYRDQPGATYYDDGKTQIWDNA